MAFGRNRLSSSTMSGNSYTPMISAADVRETLAQQASAIAPIELVTALAPTPNRATAKDAASRRAVRDERNAAMPGPYAYEAPGPGLLDPLPALGKPVARPTRRRAGRR